MTRRGPSPARRSWPKQGGVECREWMGGRNAAGYGQITRQGRHWLVHRWVWTLANGPIPSGLVVMHSCDTPPCFRLDHLRLGTQADNVAEMFGRGRASDRSGEANPRWRHGREIRARIVALWEAGMSMRAIARELGVPKTSVRDIIQRERDNT